MKTMVRMKAEREMKRAARKVVWSGEKMGSEWVEHLACFEVVELVVELVDEMVEKKAR